MTKPAKLSILHLVLVRKWFAQIVEGTKTKEYRQATLYWKRRLEGKDYDVIQFRNGYATKAPVMLVEYRGLRKQGRGHSAEYVIRLGRVLKVKRWKRTKAA